MLLSLHCRYTGPDSGPCTICQAGKFKQSVGPAACVQCSALATRFERQELLRLLDHLGLFRLQPCGQCDESGLRM
jgi:hypothetical protein